MVTYLLTYITDSRDAIASKNMYQKIQYGQKYFGSLKKICLTKIDFKFFEAKNFVENQGPGAHLIR